MRSERRSPGYYELPTDLRATNKKLNYSKKSINDKTYTTEL